MGPEAKIERQVVREAKAQGWVVHKLRFLDCRGAPDRIFGKDGRTVLIEFKRADVDAELQQLKRHMELRKHFGLQVYVCDTVALGRYVLQLREA